MRYPEFWEKGEFIKQVPEQDAVEIWKTELVLGDQVIDSQKLKVEQVPQLEVRLHYKNKSRKSTYLALRMSVSALQYKLIKQEYSPSEFKNMDLMRLIKASGFPPSTPTASYYLTVFSNGEQLRTFRLNIDY